MTQASQLIIYGTLGCHLCDDAEKVVNSVTRHFSLSHITLDIMDDEIKLTQLADKIPVVEFREQQLCWPFTQATLIAWLNQTCQSA